jgi:hypothetical protein
MALGLVFVIVAVLTGMTGCFFPPAGIAPVQAADSTTLLFLVMIVSSLYEFHYSGRRKANACRR